MKNTAEPKHDFTGNSTGRHSHENSGDHIGSTESDHAVADILNPELTSDEVLGKSGIISGFKSKHLLRK